MSADWAFPKRMEVEAYLILLVDCSTHKMRSNHLQRGKERARGFLLYKNYLQKIMMKLKKLVADWKTIDGSESIREKSSR